ncbi:uncharacterized protein MONOS_5930 [Monocercomonoides exilis]|uniref:uncharacterized protein n=1 Tax=Monocercomonoides exilis TaxID=2049356 RepID=UPI0035596D8A|nr:hypothetical protein MONOS_5930 [Monocercomonoides exilis]|eukprot:MONOS_5930.1-p1 / transcript=MONOS_5930.1 / gene=MONOS_5930 / organism=Monocercomonoides_exilis_PA203 / gene_product=unspecified product / transcript_product=unspecified product / location=Mono_scaffold00179:16914-22307(-) / protein_length=1392 / sequence_SO=supercontig / SO=protein_coding / is_pseudo=false
MKMKDENKRKKVQSKEKDEAFLLDASFPAATETVDSSLLTSKDSFFSLPTFSTPEISISSHDNSFRMRSKLFRRLRGIRKEALKRHRLEQSDLLPINSAAAIDSTNTALCPSSSSSSLSSSSSYSLNPSLNESLFRQKLKAFKEEEKAIEDQLIVIRVEKYASYLNSCQTLSEAESRVNQLRSHIQLPSTGSAESASGNKSKMNDKSKSKDKTAEKRNSTTTSSQKPASQNNDSSSSDADSASSTARQRMLDLIERKKNLIAEGGVLSTLSRLVADWNERVPILWSPVKAAAEFLCELLSEKTEFAVRFVKNSIHTQLAQAGMKLVKAVGKEKREISFLEGNVDSFTEHSGDKEEDKTVVSASSSSSSSSILSPYGILSSSSPPSRSLASCMRAASLKEKQAQISRIEEQIKGEEKSLEGIIRCLYQMSYLLPTKLILEFASDDVLEFFASCCLSQNRINVHHSLTALYNIVALTNEISCADYEKEKEKQKQKNKRDEAEEEDHLLHPPSLEPEKEDNVVDCLTHTDSSQHCLFDLFERNRWTSRILSTHGVGCHKEEASSAALLLSFLHKHKAISASFRPVVSTLVRMHVSDDVWQRVTASRAMKLLGTTEGNWKILTMVSGEDELAKLLRSPDAVDINNALFGLSSLELSCFSNLCTSFSKPGGVSASLLNLLIPGNQKLSSQLCFHASGFAPFSSFKMSNDGSDWPLYLLDDLGSGLSEAESAEFIGLLTQKMDITEENSASGAACSGNQTDSQAKGTSKKQTKNLIDNSSISSSVAILKLLVVIALNSTEASSTILDRKTSAQLIQLLLNWGNEYLGGEDTLSITDESDASTFGEKKGDELHFAFSSNALISASASSAPLTDDEEESTATSTETVSDASTLLCAAASALKCSSTESPTSSNHSVSKTNQHHSHQPHKRRIELLLLTRFVSLSLRYLPSNTSFSSLLQTLVYVFLRMASATHNSTDAAIFAQPALLLLRFFFSSLYATNKRVSTLRQSDDDSAENSSFDEEQSCNREANTYKNSYSMTGNSTVPLNPSSNSASSSNTSASLASFLASSAAHSQTNHFEPFNSKDNQKMDSFGSSSPSTENSSAQSSSNDSSQTAQLIMNFPSPLRNSRIPLLAKTEKQDLKDKKISSSDISDRIDMKIKIDKDANDSNSKITIKGANEQEELQKNIKEAQIDRTHSFFGDSFDVNWNNALKGMLLTRAEEQEIEESGPAIIRNVMKEDQNKGNLNAAWALLFCSQSSETAKLLTKPPILSELLRYAKKIDHSTTTTQLYLMFVTLLLLLQHNTSDEEMQPKDKEALLDMLFEWDLMQNLEEFKEWVIFVGNQNIKFGFHDDSKDKPEADDCGSASGDCKFSEFCYPFPFVLKASPFLFDLVLQVLPPV